MFWWTEQRQRAVESNVEMGIRLIILHLLEPEIWDWFGSSVGLSV